MEKFEIKWVQYALKFYVNYLMFWPVPYMKFINMIKELANVV